MTKRTEIGILLDNWDAYVKWINKITDTEFRKNHMQPSMAGFMEYLREHAVHSIEE